jgi:hypothetical protein
MVVPCLVRALCRVANLARAAASRTETQRTRCHAFSGNVIEIAHAHRNVDSSLSRRRGHRRFYVKKFPRDAERRLFR